ncbi:MAG: tRNA dimethylallyltransferase 2 [Melioribacteraceae bacterium]|nr:MAG: tRNA dimethylallyltransferase 2 [Melioribacteraceae bacterium]
MKYNLISIFGPTATGKTGLAVSVAQKLNCEIISADSRQVYRGMDIGTGKDLDEYTVGGYKIPHHLIDIADPDSEFDLFSYQKRFYDVYHQIRSRNNIPLLAGGTGLYVSSIIQNYELYEIDFESDFAKNIAELEDSELRKMLNAKTIPHNTTDLNTRERLIKAVMIAYGKGKLPENKFTVNSLNILVNPPAEIAANRIRKRLKERLDNGMIEEAEALLQKGISHEKLRFFGLEYKFLSLYLTGELSYNDMYQKLYSAITQFAKRQRTWFRKIEREGVDMYKIENPDVDSVLSFVKKNIENFEYSNDFPPI